MLLLVVKGLKLTQQILVLYTIGAKPAPKVFYWLVHKRGMSVGQVSHSRELWD